MDRFIKYNIRKKNTFRIDYIGRTVKVCKKRSIDEKLIKIMSIYTSFMSPFDKWLKNFYSNSIRLSIK